MGKKPTERRPDLNRCLYCGETEGTLTEEHIVPYALDGHIVVDKASCIKCQRIINEEIETPLFRKHLFLLRAVLGYKSRKGKNRFDDIKIPYRKPNGERSSLSVKREDVPETIVLPVYSEPPVIIRPDIPATERKHGSWYNFNDNEINLFLENYNLSIDNVYEFSSIHNRTFFRLLAKISHSYCYSFEDFTRMYYPVLPPYILGRRRDFELVVGSSPHPYKYEGFHPTFILSPAEWIRPDGERFLVVDMNLFSITRAPNYLVVAGEDKSNKVRIFSE